MVKKPTKTGITFVMHSHLYVNFAYGEDLHALRLASELSDRRAGDANPYPAPVGGGVGSRGEEPSTELLC